MKKLLFFLLLVPSIASANWPTKEHDCLAANIYYEARGEMIMGQYMVAFVTMNRVKSRRFPSTICGVVKQPYQFSWYSKRGKYKPSDTDAWHRAQSIAAKFIYQRPSTQIDLSEGALFYHSPKANPSWAKEQLYIGRVGDHYFYK